METIFAATLGTYRDEGFYTHRYILNKANLLADATTVRVKFQYNGAFSCTIESAYIGLRATSGNVYDIDPATLVRLQQDGENTFTITPSYNFSDPVDFVIDRTRDVIISFFGTGRPYTSWSVPTGCVRYYKYTDFAAATAESGFVTGPGVVGFLALEGESAITSFYGPIFLAEELDDVAVSSYTWNVGRVEITDGVDDVSSQGFSDACFVNVADEIDDVSISGWAAIAGSVSVQEGPDSLFMSAYSPSIGQVNIAEELDAVAASSANMVMVIEGTVLVDEYIDRVSVVGSNQANRIIIEEDCDDVAVVAGTWNAGFVNVREYLDVVSTQATRGESKGTVIVSESADSISGAVWTSNVGSISITCGLDDIGVLAGNEHQNVGSVSAEEAGDAVSLTALVCIGAMARIVDQLDSCSVVAVQGAHGAISLKEPSDVVKVSTPITIPSLGFFRPSTDSFALSACPEAGVLQFSRGSLGSVSPSEAPLTEPIRFTR